MKSTKTTLPCCNEAGWKDPPEWDTKTVCAHVRQCYIDCVFDGQRINPIGIMWKITRDPAGTVYEDQRINRLRANYHWRQTARRLLGGRTLFGDKAEDRLDIITEAV